MPKCLIFTQTLKNKTLRLSMGADHQGKFLQAIFPQTTTTTIATDPEAKWIFVCDNLNTHLSTLLVMLVAVLCEIPSDSLGKEGKRGVLKSQATRKAFLEEASHRIRFVYSIVEHADSAAIFST